jgi:hypothetical protein
MTFHMNSISSLSIKIPSAIASNEFGGKMHYPYTYSDAVTIRAIAQATA